MRYRIAAIALAVCFATFAQQAPAPIPPPAEAVDRPVPVEPASTSDPAAPLVVAPQVVDYTRNWTTIEIALSIGTLTFTLVVLGLETIIILRAQKPWSPQSILRVFGLTLILSMAVLLIAAGYSKDQTAPVMGLLGVIAGYLLGNNEKAASA